MIVMENVSKEYKNGVHALRDINLAIDDGEFVYIIGPTGSGKSTPVSYTHLILLRCQRKYCPRQPETGRLLWTSQY